MSCSCSPKQPGVYMLSIDGDQVRMLGVEQAFQEVLALGTEDEEALAGELLARLKKRNYIPDGALDKYRAALLREYKEFAARAKKDQRANGKEAPEGKMEIKILGTGCAKCHALEKAVREVVQEMGVAAEIAEVRDVNEIARTGVLLTPGLMINGKVKSAGKVSSKNEIKKYIEQEM